VKVECEKLDSGWWRQKGGRGSAEKGALLTHFPPQKLQKEML
jgi:hypothetical protein